MTPPTLADLQAQLECLKRLLALAQRAYPRQADLGPLQARTALADLATLHALTQTLRWLIEAHRLDLFADMAP